jgi:hypothetical protein
MSERNGRCAFIPDGYTRNGFIDGTDYHPDIRFVYRPSTITERTVVNGSIRFEYAKATEEGFAASEELAADLLASHLVKWDITDPDGKEVEVTAENALRVEPHAFNRIYKIIMGESVPDQIKERGTEKNLSADSGF